MITELFSIGPISISPFGVMLVAALVSAYIQLWREMQRLGIGNEDDASSITVTCGLMGILGGKIYYAILYEDLRLIFDRSGIVWYGCFILGLVAFLWKVRSRKLPLKRTLDAAAPALAVGYGVGRIGCFLVGDDYGRPTDLPWGMVFKNGLPKTTAGNLRGFGYDIPSDVADSAWVAVHPTQIYESVLGFLIWGMILWFGRKMMPAPGVTFMVGVILLSIERFGIEFLRAKDDRFFEPFTVAQVISVVIVVVASVFAMRWWEKAPASSHQALR